MPKCESCGTVWKNQDLLEREGLGHFYAPGAKRTIIEPNGQKWVVVYHKQKAVNRVCHCKSCPVVIGAAVGDA